MSDTLGERARSAKVPSLDEVRAAATARPGPQFDKAGAGKLTDRFEFDLDYTDTGRGLRWEGHFKCHVPNLAENVQIGKIMAGLRGGPPAALDELTLNLTEMIATLTVVIDEGPAWIRGNGLLEIHDLNVIVAIYGEVRDHLSRFWGANSEGANAGDGAQSRPS